MPFILLYVPGVSLFRNRRAEANIDSEESKPHEICLCLPSQILGQVEVDERLCRLEWKLRYAQAHEALGRVRQHLQVCAYLYKFKDRFVRGQGANTRARNAIESVTAKIMAAAEEYRAAYNALSALAPRLSKVSWTNELLALLDADIRDLSEGKAGESEGRRTISWIWKSVPADEKITEPGFLRERTYPKKIVS
jgi:predicted metal-dependent hydrolase